MRSFNPSQKKVCIIGAGPLGLSAAYYLSLNSGDSLDICILDASPNPGGLASSHHLTNGKIIEAFYHHVFTTDIDFIELSRELGVFGHMCFARASVGHYYNDKLYSLGGPRDVLTTDLLSLPNRLRFLIVSAFLKTGINKLFQGQTAMQGCKRFYGEEITERIWKPLLEGKFSEYQDFVPMSWLASRVRDRSMRLGYMEGSFDLFYNALFKACALNNVKSNYSYRVHSIRVGVDKVFVDDHPYDACLSTVGPVVEQNLGIDCVNCEFMYLGAICVVYELDENPQIPYWTNYCDPTSPVMAVINHRELDSSYSFGKFYPVYSAAYLTPGSQLYSLTDHDLIQLFFLPVQKIGRFSANSSSLRFNCATVYRSRYAQPLINPEVNLPPIVSFEGPLYRASMHSIYPNDRGQNYAVALGKRMAGKMAADLAS